MANSQLRIRLLPIGRADCILLQFPDLTWGIVDCGYGDAQEPDAATSALEIMDRTSPKDAPVRFIVGTHPHADHVGRIPNLMNRCSRPIQAFYHCGVDVDQAIGTPQPRTSYVDLANRLKDRGRLGEVKALCAGEHLPLDPVVPGLDILVLNPDKVSDDERYARGNPQANNASVVLQVSYFTRHLLLTGDIQKDAWNRVTGNPNFAKPDILKVSHHGADTGQPPSKQAAIRDEGACWALLSTPSSRHDFPSPLTLRDFWDMPNWTTRCTGWAPSCINQEPETYSTALAATASDTTTGDEIMRERVAYSGRTAYPLLNRLVGCCVDNVLVIDDDGKIQHSLRVRGCDRR